MTKKLCDNTNHFKKGKSLDIQKVKLLPNFDNGTAFWCYACRLRDNDMISQKNFCPHCGEDLKKYGVYETQECIMESHLARSKTHKNFDYMGIFAQTNAEITCKDSKRAMKVATILKQMAKQGDENGNFDFTLVKQDGKVVFFNQSSDRIQNLEWQMEQVWEKIKNLAEKMYCPVLAESDGLYYSND